MQNYQVTREGDEADWLDPLINRHAIILLMSVTFIFINIFVSMNDNGNDNHGNVDDVDPISINDIMVVCTFMTIQFMMPKITMTMMFILLVLVMI